MSARQRAWLHAAAEAAGIAHTTSTNADGARVLTLGDAAADAVPVALADDSDDTLRAAVLHHLPQLAAVPMRAPPSLDGAVERFQALLAQEQRAEAEEVRYKVMHWMRGDTCTTERACPAERRRPRGWPASHARV